MKRVAARLGAALLAVLLLLSSCGGNDSSEDPANTTGAPTDTSVTPPPADADTDAGETTAPVDPGETAPALVTLVAKTLAAADDGVTLTFEAILVDGVKQSAVTLVLSDASGEIAREQKTVPAGTHTVTLACPADRITGELTLAVTAAVTAMDGETIADTLSLKLQNKLPQLTPDGVRCVVAAMTLEEKAHLVTGSPEPGKQNISGGTYPIERLGVPATLFMDGTAGIRYNQSIWYPSVMNVSSSWDPALATRVGQSLGEDALAHGFDIVLGPGINIQKNIGGGRNFEYASEDPLLSGLMLAPYVSGVESTGAGTSLKHYAVNNQETSRGSVSAKVTERALREIYLKGFGIVVKDAQPMTVMSSYNALNGIHTAVNKDLLDGILRTEFGFAGMVMSDWGAAGAIADKVNAGNDINMPGGETDAADIMAACRSGVLSETALNAACSHILTMVADSATAQGVSMKTGVDFKGNGQVATEAAADTMVLLQNESATLPLKAGTSVAVFGNSAVRTIYGGFGSASVTPRKSVNILDGLAACKDLTVVNRANNPFKDCEEHSTKDDSKDIEVTEAYAREMAAAADVAVIVIGRNSAEGEDHFSKKGDYLLNDTEAAMLARVSTAFRAAGKRVVVLINTGNPIEVASWQDSVDAILWIGYPGESAGTAVAQVLTGEVNPSAKTTLTWPKTYNSTPAATYFPGSAQSVIYYEDIYVGYRYYETFDVEVSYPFGYGLSYTSFAYSDFKITESADGTVRATVIVTNTGMVAGREVVQLYVQKPETTQEQAAMELCGFAKTALLEPGKSETVTIDVRAEALMTYVTNGSRWIIDMGNYTYHIGSSVADLHDMAEVRVVSPVVVQDVENRCAPTGDLPHIEKATYEPGVSDRVNLLLNKAATSNFDESAELIAANLTDGDYVSRWSGFGLDASSEFHTLDMDLGEVYAIGVFKIYWESVSAPFTLLYSTDGTSYTTLDTFIDDGSKRTELNFYGAEARYIRLQIKRTGGFTSIFEIEAYEATDADIEAGENRPGGETRPNLAVGKPVEVSGVEGNYLASNAVDGDVSTRWGSLPEGEGWIVIDLEAVSAVTEIKIHLESAWVPYVVEYSVDGENYTVLHSGAKDELSVTCEDLAIEARYVRVRREGSNWFSIYEIYVYGK